MPNVISMYNRRMGGIEQLDKKKHFSLLHCDSRKKGYYPLFCYLLNVCVNNAWVFSRAGDYADDACFH